VGLALGSGQRVLTLRLAALALAVTDGPADWQAEYDRLREDPREVAAGPSANPNENAL
jgi:hypothetical protein